ncbi:MAG: hypothetical protein JXA23_02745, partial [Bacteroidales bacterium]|nr:hypothetical protein [Bacteroidales bacterium]
LSAFQIIFTTSVPVYNALLGTRIAPPLDAVGFYNKWQTPYALLIAAFIGFSQFLHYQQNSWRSFLRKSSLSGFVALLLTVPFVTSGIVRNETFILFLFFIWFSLVSSLLNLLFRMSTPRNMPAVLTHTGLAVFLLGVLITFSNSRVISSNTSGIDLGDRQSNRENLLLVKGDTLYMGGFYVSYISSEVKVNTTTYRVDFLKRIKGNYTNAFSLFPSVNRHPRMGNVYNPDTRHFLLKDYYTYIATTGKEDEYIVIKTIINPYINVLWLGSLIMIAGFLWSLIRRIRRAGQSDPNNTYTP